MKLFSLDHANNLSRLVAERLAVELSPVEVRQFADGEYKVRPLVDVAGTEVFVVDSLFSDDRASGTDIEGARSVHDKLCLFLFFVGALKDAMAKSVTLVAPYLCYTRKDRRTKSRDPLTLRYVAQCLEAAGVDHAVSIDVHNVAAFEAAFRIPTVHLEAQDLLKSHVIERVSDEPLLVLSPDLGGIKRAEQFRKIFVVDRKDSDVTLGFVEKARSEGIVTSGSIVGDPKGRVVVIIDDLISSGETVAKAAHACMNRGAKRVLITATHGTFTKDVESNLYPEEINEVSVTNSVLTEDKVPARLRDKVSILDCSRVIARTIEMILEKKCVTASHS